MLKCRGRTTLFDDGDNNNGTEITMRQAIVMVISSVILSLHMMSYAADFNPQPASPDKQASGKQWKPGEKKARKEGDSAKQKSAKALNPREAKGFNPQPDPPGKQLNPQKGAAQ